MHIGNTLVEKKGHLYRKPKPKSKRSRNISIFREAGRRELDGDDRATFTVVDMDRHRIDKIRVVLEHAPESDES